FRRRSYAASELESVPESRTGLACLVGLSFAVAFSLLHLRVSFPSDLIIHPWVLLVELTYIFFFLCSVACCLFEGERHWMTALLLTLAVTAAEEASNPNFVYSVPLLVPLLCALLARRRLTLRPAAAGAVVAATY